MLVLTNLSLARNPYNNAKKVRPNPRLFRTAMFNFTDIQRGRQLEEIEVKQINYITKRRALRYVAAAQEDWLYPERDLPTTHWRNLDDRYLFMPDPRALHLGGEIMIGYEDGRSAAFDEFGRRPWRTIRRATKVARRSARCTVFKAKLRAFLARSGAGKVRALADEEGKLIATTFTNTIST